MLLATVDATVQAGLSTAGGAAGYSDNLPLTSIVANTINVILGLSGMAFVGLLVYAGVLYLTAAGSEDNVKKAKKLITNAIIGIIIIAASYAISLYVFTALTHIVGQTTS